MGPREEDVDERWKSGGVRRAVSCYERHSEGESKDGKRSRGNQGELKRLA